MPNFGNVDYTQLNRARELLSGATQRHLKNQAASLEMEKQMADQKYIENTLNAYVSATSGADVSPDQRNSALVATIGRLQRVGKPGIDVGNILTRFIVPEDVNLTEPEMAMKFPQEYERMVRTRAKATAEFKPVDMPNTIPEIIIAKHTKDGVIDYQAALKEDEQRQLRLAQGKKEPQVEDFFSYDESGTPVGLKKGVSGAQKFAALKHFNIRLENAQQNLFKVHDPLNVGIDETLSSEMDKYWRGRIMEYESHLNALKGAKSSGTTAKPTFKYPGQ